MKEKTEKELIKQLKTIAGNLEEIEHRISTLAHFAQEIAIKDDGVSCVTEDAIVAIGRHLSKAFDKKCKDVYDLDNEHVEPGNV